MRNINTLTNSNTSNINIGNTINNMINDNINSNVNVNNSNELLIISDEEMLNFPKNFTDAFNIGDYDGVSKVRKYSTVYLYYLFICLFIQLSFFFYLSIYLFTYLFIYLLKFLYLFSNLFIFLFIFTEILLINSNKCQQSSSAFLLFKYFMCVSIHFEFYSVPLIFVLHGFFVLLKSISLSFQLLCGNY